MIPVSSILTTTRAYAAGLRSHVIDVRQNSSSEQLVKALAVAGIPPLCPHLTDFRSRHGGGNPFFALQDCLRVKPLGRASISRDPQEVPRCGACGLASPRLYACVSCAAVSCHIHASMHATQADGEQESHQIAVDVGRAELFCCACCDQVYDSDFDVAVVLAQTAASTLGGGQTILSLPPPENLRKRLRVDYRHWTPDLRDRELAANSSSPLLRPGEDSSLDLPWGLKGLNNLGNSCFMNSVLQALLHTPPLRNYFLSDRHNRYFCQQKSRVQKSAGNNKNPNLCLACYMDAMCSVVFSGDRIPSSPAKFLYSWWQHAANLASYEQQDAHEIFISMLDGIHEKVEKDRRKPHSQGCGFRFLHCPRRCQVLKFSAYIQPASLPPASSNDLKPGGISMFMLGSGDCCIAHRVFSGILLSDVTCTVCGFTSTTYDPCIDISLDLEQNLGSCSKILSTKSQHFPNGEADSMNSSHGSGISTLIGCLDRFTRPERLGSDQKFFCQQCQVRQKSLKQMSIRKLPLVSCFHIKRFEHSPVRNMSRKIDRYLQFPFTLDLAPYLSSSILRSRFGNRIFTFDEEEPDASSEMSSEFELFAVITHTVNENIVRAAQGYIMFYVQKMLYYKASAKPAAS